MQLLLLLTAYAYDTLMTHTNGRVLKLGVIEKSHHKK